MLHEGRQRSFTSLNMTAFLLATLQKNFVKNFASIEGSDWNEN